MSDWLALRFLGVGNARAAELGSAAAVLELHGEPALLIDCGPRTLDDYAAHYGAGLPPAVFVTHLHLDHIGGLEQLFYRAFFERRDLVKLFAPPDIIPALHAKLAGSAFVLSEGGANYWDAFQLVPAGEHFWLQDLLFTVFPVRHSGYRAAFGLALPGAFLYSGDTRPIPEILGHYASAGERVFHDCGLAGSPAHAGLEDIKREYTPAQWQRMIAYHYESETAGRRLEEAGMRIARRGERFVLKYVPQTPSRTGSGRDAGPQRSSNANGVKFVSRS